MNDFSGCGSKKFGPDIVADFWCAESEIYKYFVIEYYAIINGPKLGGTYIHVWLNGSGKTVYLEKLR